MEQLKTAQKENADLKEKLKQYHELDPDELEKLNKDSKVNYMISLILKLTISNDILFRLIWKLLTAGQIIFLL